MLKYGINKTQLDQRKLIFYISAVVLKRQESMVLEAPSCMLKSSP